MRKFFKFKFTNLKQGFTLIEMIIYMGLLSGFLIILSNIFGAILSVRIESQASSNAEQDGRFIITRLSYDVNRAITTSVPNATTLVLTLPGSQTNTYSLNSSKLQLAQPVGTDFLNSSGSTVSSLTFQKVANSSGREETIKVQLSLSSVTQRAGGSEVRNFNTTIGRRIR